VNCCELESFFDLLSFTLQDLGVYTLEGCTDSELLEIANRKLRMLFELSLAAGVSREILEAAMRG